MDTQSRARKILRTKGISVLVATMPENVAYLTGFHLSTNIRQPMRRVYCAFAASESGGCRLVLPTGVLDVIHMQDVCADRYRTYGPFFVVDAETTAVLDESERAWGKMVRNNVPAIDFLSALTETLGELLEPGVVCAVDEGRITPQEWEALQRAFPGVKFAPGYEVLRRMRAVKSTREVEGIRTSTSITEQALWHTLNSMHEGMTEVEVASIFMRQVAEKGALPTLTCIGSGPRAGYPTVEPSDRRLRKGDTVRFDVGCLWEGWHSDMARTAIVGEPSKKQAQYYDALLEGEKAAIAAIRPGSLACDVFRTAVEVVRERGIPHYQRNHVGHGEGLEGYEHPLLNPNNCEPIEEGMVMCVETPYYEVGFGALHVEDTVVVTGNGTLSLTTIPRGLFIVE